MAPPRPVRSPVGRFAATDISFGPTGRVVTTLVLLVPLWWASQMGAFGVPLMLFYSVTFLQMALRDTWRRPR
ncbi:MAG TPA: hypothetical protein VF661_07955 [Actinomycetales bacterium]